MKRFLLITIAVCAFAADPKLTPEMQAVTNHISADSLRGNLSFLASDLLEGRSPDYAPRAQYHVAGNRQGECRIRTLPARCACQ